MEVAIPSQPLDLDFDFNSARSSPYPTAPSTPKRFGDYYCSAPTSPSHLSQIYRAFDAFFEDEREVGYGRRGGVPFDWEEKPGTPKSPVKKSAGDDFEFDVFSEDWETASVAADELFDGGVIKPLKPPPRLQTSAAGRIGGGRSTSTVSSSPMISQTKKLIQGAFSPRHRNSKREINGYPFAIVDEIDTGAAGQPQRGRERNTNMPKSSSRRAARSLSPLRDTQYPWEEEQKQPLRDAKNPSDSSTAAPAPSKTISHKKWRLKDFFLFRSASEGRAADKDPLKKYTAALRHSSFRVNEGSGSKRRGRPSAHELHYTANRAVSEDLKKKTFLPYKQGILGRLSFNPAVHALANGFGFSRK